MALGNYQNNISSLVSLQNTRYERIFKLYTTKDNQYFYNLLQSIYIPGEIDKTALFYMPVKQSLPWSIISFNAYGTMDLWWLITLTNQIYNPVISPTAGTILKIIRPEYVPDVLAEINQALQ